MRRFRFDTVASESSPAARPGLQALLANPSLWRFRAAILLIRALPRAQLFAAGPQCALWIGLSSPFQRLAARTRYYQGVGQRRIMRGALAATSNALDCLAIDHGVPMPAAYQPPGRVAAVDHGSVRIGIALSDPERRFASPHCVYERRDAAADQEFFRRLAAEERVARFVVGLPVHLDGRESQQSYESRKFAVALAEATGVPVDLFDERFTSSQADEYLADAKLTKKRRKARRDMLAAQVLLSAYLESGCRGEPAPGGIDDAPRGGRA